MTGKAFAVWPIMLAVIVAAFLVMQGIASAQKDSTPKRWDKLALGEEDVVQLLLLVDTDENGKIIHRTITKQEWLKFTQAEFDRLDNNKTGEVDANELRGLRLRERCFSDRR